MSKTNLNNITKQFDDILQKIGEFKCYISMIQHQVKDLEKSTKKEIKQLEKELDKRKRKNTRSPSGFAKPTKISDSLCKFMNKPVGSEVARTDVTQYLINYIKTNKLQNEENKKYIKPDEKLNELLNVTEDDEVTYFNIQSYMNQHFLKNKNKNKKEISKSCDL